MHPMHKLSGSVLAGTDIPLSPCRYLDPDMYSMMEDNSVTIRSKKFKKLTKAICGLVSFIVINCIV